MPRFRALGIGDAETRFIGYYELASWIAGAASERIGPPVVTHFHWANKGLSPNFISWDVASASGAVWNELERVYLDGKQINVRGIGEGPETKLEFRRWTADIAVRESHRTIRTLHAESDFPRTATDIAYTNVISVQFLISKEARSIAAPGSRDRIEFNVILGAGWIRDYFRVAETVAEGGQRRAVLELRDPARHCGQFVPATA